MTNPKLDVGSLRNPPIKEAIADFKIKHSSPFNIELINNFKQLLNGKYTSGEAVNEVKTLIDLTASNPKVKTDTSNKLVGQVFESINKEYFLRFTLEGITLSRINGYTTWEDFLSEITYVWQQYTDLVTDFVVTRTALRYVNVIGLPEEAVDFDDYLTKCPQIPEKLPQSLVEFSSRLVIPFEKPKGSLSFVILTQAYNRGIEPRDRINVLIDIDVFNEKQYKSSDGFQQELLDSLREIKNETFFSSITDKTLELIK